MTCLLEGTFYHRPARPKTAREGPRCQHPRGGRASRKPKLTWASTALWVTGTGSHGGTRRPAGKCPPPPCSEPEPRPLSSGSPVMPVPVLQPPLRPQSELRLPFGKYDRQYATGEHHILLPGMNYACTLWPPAAAPTVCATECRPAPVALAADRRATPPTASRSIGDAAAVHRGGFVLPSGFTLA